MSLQTRKNVKSNGHSSLPIEIRDNQKVDSSISWIVSHLQKGVKPDWCDVSDKNLDTRSLYNQWESLKLINSFLYRKCLVDGKDIEPLVVPESHRLVVLEYLHGKNVHVGISRTAQLCKARFYWPRWREDLKKYFKLYCLQTSYCTI